MLLIFSIIASLLGLIFLLCAVLFFRGKSLRQFSGMQKDIEATFNKKACIRFWGYICLSIAIIYFCIAVLAILDLIPLSVLRVFLFAALILPLSNIYVNKSKRFRNIETKQGDGSPA